MLSQKLRTSLTLNPHDFATSELQLTPRTTPSKTTKSKGTCSRLIARNRRARNPKSEKKKERKKGRHRRGTRDALTQGGGDHGNGRHERERMATLQRLPLLPHGGGRRAEAPVSYIPSRHGHDDGCRCRSASPNCRRRGDSVRITFVFTIP